MSVSETGIEFNPWWQLMLPPDSIVRTIHIWPKNPQEWITPVVSFTIKALNAYPRGTFIVKLSKISSKNPDLVVHTEEIQLGASALDIQSAFEKLFDIGQVSVQAVDLEPCTEIGCGAGEIERGFGRKYQVTFNDIEASYPQLEILDISAIGGLVYVDGKINLPNPLNQLVFYMDVKVKTIRKGEFIEVPFVKNYAKGVEPPDQNTPDSVNSEASSGINPWLIPCWVMLFNETYTPPPDSLEAALNVALWKHKLESIDTLSQIILLEPMGATVLRIQRAGYGQLSLAEVEVYSEAVNVLREYGRTVDVEASPLTRPYQPGSNHESSPPRLVLLLLLII